jgi:lipoprotein LprG
MRARRLTVLATAATAAAALALAGCSGSDSDTTADPSASVGASTAPSASAAAPGDEVTTEAAETGSGDLTLENFAQTVSEASIDAGSYKFQMKMSADGAPVTDASGAVETADGKQAVLIEMDVAGTKAEVRYVDGIWYLNYGEPTGNKFMKIDPKNDDSDIAKQFEQMASQMNPSAGLEATKEAVTSVTKKGAPVEIGGVQAQPYEVVVDPSKVTGTAGEQLKAAGAALPDELVYTYWIGEDNLLRRMTFELPGSSTEMTLTDWGSDVDVKAPKDSEISDVPMGS